MQKRQRRRTARRFRLGADSWSVHFSGTAMQLVTCLQQHCRQRSPQIENLSPGPFLILSVHQTYHAKGATDKQLRLLAPDASGGDRCPGIHDLQDGTGGRGSRSSQHHSARYRGQSPHVDGNEPHSDGMLANLQGIRATWQQSLPSTTQHTPEGDCLV